MWPFRRRRTRGCSCSASLWPLPLPHCSRADGPLALGMTAAGGSPADVIDADQGENRGPAVKRGAGSAAGFRCGRQTSGGGTLTVSAAGSPPLRAA
jgi:hypothetical protein